jgi:hypothetical protein
MFERRISTDDVRQTLSTGETVERYPDDAPYPSRLVVGSIRGRVIHVVVADNMEDAETIVITAYEPDPAQWEPGFKRRKA